jgi:hypothetical protein
MILAGQKLPADQNACQSHEAFLDVGTFLVADTQSAKLVEPGKAPLYHPSPSAKSTAVLGIPHREQRQNTAVA